MKITQLQTQNDLDAMGVLRQQLKQTVVFLIKFICWIVAQALKAMTMASMMVVRLGLPHTTSCCRPVSAHRQ